MNRTWELVIFSSEASDVMRNLSGNLEAWRRSPPAASAVWFVLARHSSSC
jgi:hypothetical protein